MIDVSFIIVSWNAREYLLECLESIPLTVENCTYEIIVVDNDSSDGSPEAVEQRYPNARLIRTGSNLGFAKGNNIGIRESSGRFLCLMNSDVVLRRGCIDRLYERMRDNPKAGMMGPRVLNADGSLQPSCRRFPSLFRSLCSSLGLSSLNPMSSLLGGTFMTWWNHDDSRRVDVISGCFMFVQRRAIEQVGLLDEAFFMYGEDIDWCRRFNEGRWQVAFNPAAEAIHYGGASSSNCPVSMYVAMQESRFKYWKKHHGAFSRIGLASITLLHHGIRIAARSVLYVAVRADRRENASKIRRSYAAIVWLLSGAAEINGQRNRLDGPSGFGVET